MENIYISKGTIQQITCKHKELLVILTNQQHEWILITFNNPISFKGENAIGAEITGIYKDEEFNTSIKAERANAIHTEKNYCFKASKGGEDVFTVVAESYNVDRI